MFNNVCDEEFNCDVYNHDRGHCAPPADVASPASPTDDQEDCTIDDDQESSCVEFVSHCGTPGVRQRCPTTCSFGSYAPECANPCRCTANGLSGTDAVPGRGCGYFSPDLDPFCFVQDPQNCQTALPSSLLTVQADSHAEWRYCSPTEEDGFSATCFDNLQNGDETCIDGGGSCPPCACPVGDIACLCHDGMLSPGEQIVDCGGPCACAALPLSPSLSLSLSHARAYTHTHTHTHTHLCLFLCRSAMCVYIPSIWYRSIIDDGLHVRHRW